MATPKNSKEKPSASPPVQLAQQSRSCKPSGHTSPILRTKEIQIFPFGYPQVQGYPVQPAQVPHDMNKQQPVAAGLKPAPSVAAPQQQGLFQQQQAGLRTPSYYKASQPQGMRPPRYMPQTAQPNQMYPAMYQYMGQTQGQGYPGTSVMVQQQGQIMYQPSRRMATPRYLQNTQIQQIAATAAKYPNQATQQYGSTPQYQTVYYQPFAAEVAATLTPNQSPHTEEVSAPDSLPQREIKDKTGALPPECVPESHSVEASSSEEPVSESAVDEPQQVPVHEPSIPETITQQPFTEPPDTVSGTSDDSDIPIWSETLNAKAKASGNVKRQEDEFLPASKSSSDVELEDLSEEKKKTKGYPVQPAQVPHDMNKQQPVAAGLMPAPSVAAPQQEGLCQQQQAGLRTQSNEEPVCTVCRTVFKHTGPVPYLLPCMHAVCESCVTTSENRDIGCRTCGSHVDTRKGNLCPDLITQRRVLDLTIKQRPSDILCTHEDDRNQAVCWCQECEQFLCEHCQNVHQSIKVTRRHSIQEITSALCNTVSKVEYCSVHKIYPLDTWDKTCKILICVRCRRDLHAEHDVQDVEVAEEELKSEIETQLLQMKSVESNFKKMSRKMEQQIRHAEDVGAVQKKHLKQTFQSLRQLLDQREKEVLVKLDQLTSRIIQEAKLQEQTAEVKQEESKKTTEYIASVLSYPNKRALFPLKPIITERTESCRLTGKAATDKKSTIPHFNSQELEHLKSLISNFSDVESLQKDTEEPTSAGNPIDKDGEQKAGLRGKKKLRDLNQIVEEEGTDMDAFLDGEFDVKLHQSENAWKSSRMRAKKKDRTETQSEDLYRKIRSILNKLTPEKFQTLVQKVRGLVIDTETKLKGVTDIIFENAISEPAFTAVYANMCRYLLRLKVPSDTKPGESVDFRVILLTRCQREFEKNMGKQCEFDKRKEEIEVTESVEKKAEMEEELEIFKAKARKRSVGNIRFIGELFKLKMLSETIMHDCIIKLLTSRDEVNLECLCQLLTTIGKELESEEAKQRMDRHFQRMRMVLSRFNFNLQNLVDQHDPRIYDMDQHFKQMKKIVTEKKVSCRCRFMLQDVIDLRDNNWKPRRYKNNP